ncbi:hypothetical protein LXL04_018146 [Taraxacum kok-saghyz]
MGKRADRIINGVASEGQSVDYGVESNGDNGEADDGVKSKEMELWRRLTEADEDSEGIEDIDDFFPVSDSQRGTTEECYAIEDGTTPEMCLPRSEQPYFANYWIGTDRFPRPHRKASNLGGRRTTPPLLRRKPAPNSESPVDGYVGYGVQEMNPVVKPSLTGLGRNPDGLSHLGFSSLAACGLSWTV